ncbi:M23 family metallopeptidase [Paracoccus albus]|uniref:M23 family metallopeptidase n=1 Tax=Paracoccus albus TaxID=3017784 RepID=UPI0022F0F8DD|nr:M23 family metallopeptidase [Paracoccus albus]WBU59372.1 M23 family metallopeptidase [Paracoccus albus]
MIKIHKLAALVMALSVPWTAPLAAQQLELPIDCQIGQDCFVQQFPDMDPSEGAQDPFCGKASYDGHKGLDIRLRSLNELARNVAVVAAAEGVVLAVRDGEPDRLVIDEETRDAVRDKECGNGVVLRHGNGLETQYCHMKRGSVAVQPGDKVQAGDRLGSVGASGLAQFPHVHLTVRRDGSEVDPFSGRNLTRGCDAEGDSDASLFEEKLRSQLSTNDVQIIDFGLAGAPLDYDRLTVEGAPEEPRTTSPGIVGWVWVINLKPADILSISIVAPDGTLFSEGESKPQDRQKADFTFYAGRPGQPLPGDYRVEVAVIRNNSEIMSGTKTITVSE